MEKPSSSNDLDNVYATNSDPTYDIVESVDSSKLHENTGVQPVIEISESTQVIPPNDASIHVSFHAFSTLLLILWPFYVRLYKNNLKLMLYLLGFFKTPEFQRS